MNSNDNNLKHLAIIMDGNARWAATRSLPNSEGHRRGAENIRKLIQNVLKFDISYLTLYAFSSENWQRGEQEISILISLLSYYLKKETKVLIENEIRLKIIGDLTRLKPSMQDEINAAIDKTKHNDRMTLCIAFGYGSRAEIVEACKKIIVAGEQDISEDNFKNYLYDPEMPDVDLLIRTSGLSRISNFLLWQSAYAELYFCDKNWPDFSEEDLVEALNNYAKRRRTFGTRQ